jgi:Fe-S cluster biosynthesis and repair protein YggX
MTRLVDCVKLKKSAEGLDKAPYASPLGQKIYDHISKEAWQLWLGHQTMLMNEYRLSSIDPKARQFLLQELEKFLFGEGSDKPQGYVPPGQ